MRKSARIGSVVLLAAIIIIAVAAFWFYAHVRSWLYAPIAQLNEVTLYEVPRGAALVSVLNDLEKRGVVEHPRELLMWARFMRPSFSLKAGEYELLPGMSPVECIDLFNSGKVLLHKITIVEGTTAKDLRTLLAAQTVIKITTRQMSMQEVMQHFDRTNPNPEGEFFPDTYLFPKGTTDLEILRLAHERMSKELERAWAGRDIALPLANAYEALILASIIEKETAQASERPMIAGVFVERLRKGMRLQTDPTVIYGLGDLYDGNIHKADLLRDTPYNTYTRTGLPPTPICLPSAAALDAAVHPKQTGALFFVATGNGDGSHHFSRTLEEHNAALQRYLKTLRQR